MEFNRRFNDGELSMTTNLVIQIGREAITTALLIVAPIMAVGFVVGTAISILQTIMQIQEMTLSFVPKLVAIGFAIIVFGSWMLTQLMDYSQKILGGFPHILGLK
jgi:flagellar biosynthesis protein FliQ